jgi:ligand-binding sensor domain-containing protein
MAGVKRQPLRCPLLGLLGALLLLLRAGAGMAAPADPWAPFESPWFDKVSSAEGFPPAIVTALAQDREGLLWVGTMVGLARYDGYRTQLFDVRGEPVKGLPDAYVRCLLALPDGGMLIGTNAGGLVRFDPATNTFHVYPGGPDGISDRKIFALADDHAGGVWVATEQGLDHLDLRSNAIRHVDTGSDTAPRNFSVMQDRAGNLWLGNNEGLFVRHAGSDRFERPAPPGDAVVATVLENQIWAIDEDSAGRLWIGSGQAGAVYRGPHGNWHPVPQFSGYRKGAQHATVRDFQEAAPGTMWIATDGSGVLAYRPGDASLQRIEHDPAVPSSLPGDAVRALLHDRAGNLWAATDLGLARAYLGDRGAFSVLPSPLESNMLSDTSVRGVYVDSRGLVWIGLSAGRIDVIDLRAGQMRHLRLGGTQTLRDVQSFAEAADGSIWVGTQGLAKVDPHTFEISSSVLPALENTPVLCLRMDGNRLLIGTYDGLFRYDTGTGVLDHIRHDPDDPTSLVSNTVRQILKVGDEWWYSTSRGISIAPDSGASRGFRTLTHREGDPASLPGDSVSAATPGPRGHLWVSTSGGLAESIGKNPWRFSSIGVAEGLLSDKVTSALSDGLGHIWASTSSGVARVDAGSHAVRNLSSRDGLHIRSYHYADAAAHAPDGSLLFGGLGGLTVIRPAIQIDDNDDAPLAITHAVLGAVALPFGKLPHDGDTITLDQRNRNLRVDFSLLDYRSPRRNLVQLPHDRPGRRLGRHPGRRQTRRELHQPRARRLRAVSARQHAGHVPAHGRKPPAREGRPPLVRDLVQQAGRGRAADRPGGAAGASAHALPAPAGAAAAATDQRAHARPARRQPAPGRAGQHRRAHRHLQPAPLPGAGPGGMRTVARAIHLHRAVRPGPLQAGQRHPWPPRRRRRDPRRGGGDPAPLPAG